MAGKVCVGNGPTEAELEAMLHTAWKRVIGESPSLLDYGNEESSMERSLCFRLGVHLDVEVSTVRPTWSSPWSEVVVDEEVHLAHDGSKFRKPGGTESPDLIVHRRGCDDANLLVIEAKHRNNDIDPDLVKLRLLHSQRFYRHAWAVRLDQPNLKIVERLEREAVGAHPRIASAKKCGGHLP